MARISLIFAFILTSLTSMASVRVFIINQHDQCFTADRDVWVDFFHRRYHINALTLKSYSSKEVDGIFSELTGGLTRTDTLILIVDSHAAQDGTIVLRDPGNKFTSETLRSHFYRSDQLQHHLSVLNHKGVRLLIIVNTCEAISVLPPDFSVQLKSATVLYATQSFTIGSPRGTYLPHYFKWASFSSVSDYARGFEELMKDKALYVGDMASGYPIKPLMVGPNFTF